LICVGGARSFEPAFRLIMALEQEYRVIAPAYPYADHLDCLVKGLARILDVEQVTRVHLWGTSLGGIIVQSFVRRYLCAGRDHGPKRAPAKKPPPIHAFAAPDSLGAAEHEQSHSQGIAGST
jgi:hypothetical protein